MILILFAEQRQLSLGLVCVPPDFLFFQKSEKSKNKDDFIQLRIEEISTVEYCRFIEWYLYPSNPSCESPRVIIPLIGSEWCLMMGRVRSVQTVNPDHLMMRGEAWHCLAIPGPPLLRTRPLTDGAQNNNTWGETPNISQMWLDLFAIKQSLMLAPDLVMAVSRMFRAHHRVVILPLPTRTRPDSVQTSWATQLLPGNPLAQQRKIFISRSTFISFIFAWWARCQDV